MSETHGSTNQVPGPLSAGTAAFPHAAPRTGALGELVVENIVYSCDPGYRPLFLDLRIPRTGEGPKPLVVWVHGGGWMQGSRRRLPPNLFKHRLHDRMVEHGYAVAAIDYRLAREAPFPGMLLDLLAAIRWLRAHAAGFNLDARRVVVWGESAGGHMAAMIAVCTRLEGVARTGEYFEQPEQTQAVVDWYGPSDFTRPAVRAAASSSQESPRTPEHPIQVMQQSCDWSLADMSPATYVRADLPPILLAHGSADEQVPVDQSRSFYAKLRAAGAEVDYMEVEGAMHVWVNAPSVPEIIDRSLAFVDNALGATAARKVPA
ncbi:MAG: alpha/beta hydrolase [Chloroflexi bacterium]|nr:alpha/beta hydrolase [Chloroflexota bacterium]